jgi:hypothetical protein
LDRQDDLSDLWSFGTLRLMGRAQYEPWCRSGNGGGRETAEGQTTSGVPQLGTCASQLRDMETGASSRGKEKRKMVGPTIF